MVVVYSSNTGYTEQYAKLLAKQLDVPAYSLDNVPDCHKGREVVYLGWLMNGSIVGCKKAAKLYKLRAACGVGMSPPNDSLPEALRKKSGVPGSVPVFYLQGGFNMQKLNLPFKLIMQVINKKTQERLSAKGSLSPAEQITYNMTQGEASAVDEAALAPVIAALK